MSRPVGDAVSRDAAAAAPVGCLSVPRKRRNNTPTQPQHGPTADPATRAAPLGLTQAGSHRRTRNLATNQKNQQDFALPTGQSTGFAVWPPRKGQNAKRFLEFRRDGPNMSGKIDDNLARATQHACHRHTAFDLRMWRPTNCAKKPALHAKSRVEEVGWHNEGWKHSVVVLPTFHPRRIDANITQRIKF
ncbi:hypothetical protein VTK56DRAFT_5948 [Thermocarpiscus australiensis]